MDDVLRAKRETPPVGAIKPSAAPESAPGPSAEPPRDDSVPLDDAINDAPSSSTSRDAISASEPAAADVEPSDPTAPERPVATLAPTTAAAAAIPTTPRVVAAVKTSPVSAAPTAPPAARGLDPRLAIAGGFLGGAATVGMVLLATQLASSNPSRPDPLAIANTLATSDPHAVPPAIDPQAGDFTRPPLDEPPKNPEPPALPAFVPPLEPPRPGGPLVKPTLAVAETPLPVGDREPFYSFAEVASHPALVGTRPTDDPALLPAFQRLLGLARAPQESLRAAAARLARWQAFYFAARGLPIDAARLDPATAAAALRASLETPVEVRDAKGLIVGYRDPATAFAANGAGATILPALADHKLQRARRQAEADRVAAWDLVWPIAEAVSRAARDPIDPPAVTLTLDERGKLVGAVDPLASLVAASRDPRGRVYALRLERDGPHELKNVAIALEATDAHGVVKRTVHFLRVWPAGAPLVPDPAVDWESQPAAALIRVSWKILAENARPVEGEKYFPEHAEAHVEELLATGDPEAALAALEAFEPVAAGSQDVRLAVIEGRVDAERMQSERDDHLAAFEVGRAYAGTWSLGARDGEIAMNVRPAPDDPLREPGARAVTLRLFDRAAPQECCDFEAIVGRFDPVAKRYYAEVVKPLAGLPDDGENEAPRTRDFLLGAHDELNASRGWRFGVASATGLVGECRYGAVLNLNLTRGRLRPGQVDPFWDRGAPLHPQSVAVAPFPLASLPPEVTLAAFSGRGEVWRQRLAEVRRAGEGESVRPLFVGFATGKRRVYAGAVLGGDRDAKTHFYDAEFRPELHLRAPSDAGFRGTAAWAFHDLNELWARSDDPAHRGRVEAALQLVGHRALSRPELWKEITRDGPATARLVWSPTLDAVVWERDGELVLYDFAADKARAALKPPDGPITAAAFASDGRKLFLGLRGGAIGVWDVPTLAREQDVVRPPAAPDDARPSRVVALWSHPRTPSLMALIHRANDPAAPATGDYELHLFDPSRRDEPGYTLRTGWKNPLVVPSPDWRFVLVSQLGRLSLWDFRTGEEYCRFVGHTRPVSAMAFSFDGAAIVTVEEAGPSPWLVQWEVPLPQNERAAARP